MERLIGQSLGRYKIVKLLGEGGMGAVFLATDVTLQRDVAIKIMHPHTARDANFRERFLQEARTAARLDHPSIVQVHDFGQEGSLLYIVMNFIKGSNLRDMLDDLKAQNTWIPLQEATGIVRQVALAMDYAHRQGVLHRDLKPSNIMIEPDATEELPYRPVLTDLGLARLMQGQRITQAGLSMGTPTYMSPEQAAGQSTDARSDVYSLGVMLYELSVGRPPFEISSITEAIRYHTKEPPPPPRSIRPDLPVRLEQIILKSLIKDPNQRWANAGDLAKALESFAADGKPSAHTPAVQVPSGPAAAPPSATAVQGSAGVSLLTQYQQVVDTPRGESILQEFNQGSVNRDTIQIRMPDGATSDVPFTGQSMTIGRTEGNAIILNTNMVSRQHARIDFDGTNYSVTDLNSTNHTFIGNTQLLPGVPEKWLPNQPLRVGDVWMRLVRASAGAPKGTAVGPAAYSPTGVIGGTRVGGAMGSPMLRSSVGGGEVGIVMEENVFSVEPGSSINFGVTLLNQGSVVDHFTTMIDGIPTQWVDLPEVVQLMPGQQQQVTFTIHPPKHFQSRAGRYNFSVRVMSQNNPSQHVDARGTLTVLPFTQFQSQVQPQKLAAGKTITVTVNNQGNIREAFVISGQDRENALTFEPPEVRIGAPEGQTATAEMRVFAGKRPLLGRPQTFPFTMQVTQGKVQPQIHAGELVNKPIIPGWLPPIVITLALLLCVTVAMLVTRPPVIDLAEVIPPNPVADEPVTIRWRVRRAQNIELRPRGIEVSASGQGEYTFEEGFDESVAITLVASNMFRNTQETLNISVDALIIEPVVEDWSVFPTEIIQGQEVTVKWSVVNAENVKVQPFGTVDNTGERKESPQQTRTYTLIATNQGQSIELSQEVIVNLPEPDAPILTTFSVDPTTIVTSEGAIVRLTWQTEQADTVTIEPGLGVVGLSGSRDVPAPEQDTIFVLVAKGPGGTTQGQVQVFVQDPKCLVGSNVNLRSGPGTSYEPPIRVLNTGMELEPLSYSATGFPDGQWVEVKVVGTGETGWISTGFVANCNVTVTELPPGTIPATPTPSPTTTPTVTPTPTTPTPTSTGLVLIPLPLPIFPLFQPVASYPLDGNAKDATGNYGNMSLTNTSWKDGGLALNGIAYDVATTPKLGDMDFNAMTIYASFKVTQKKRMPVFVGGTSYRWIGFYLDADGKVELMYNNSKYQECSLSYDLNTWHNAMVTYDGSVGKLYLDDKLGCTVAFNMNHNNDNQVTTGNYSNGQVYKGILKNLRIYDRVITPK
ncbi:MAG: protein kinase [Anaerolineae bacterium]|nr:protein kinase [Anaerolineae bacterium]